MYLEKPLSVTISMAVLLLLLAVSSAVGNGFVLAILARFKKLRNYANTLIANLALVDLLNSLINLPFYLLYGVLKVSWFKGKTLAFLSSFFNRLFILLNLASMLMLLVNVFLALTFDLRYFTWKTNEKAMAIVLVEWLVCLAVVTLSCLPLFEIDLQNADVLTYRQVIFEKNKTVVASSMTLFILCAIVLGTLVLCSVRRKKLKRKQLHLPQLQAEARLKMDIQAAKTVAITILAFLLCYIPPVVFAMWRRYSSEVTWWPNFLAQFSIFFSSGISPVIYCFRNKRFRTALKQLFKDPCGGRSFQETNQIQRAQLDIPRQRTRQATANNNITDDPNEASLAHTARVAFDRRARCHIAGLEERSLKVQDREEEESSRNEGQSNGLRTRNKVIPLSLPEFERVAKLAWVQNHQINSAGSSSGNYPRQEVSAGKNRNTEDSGSL